MKGTGEDFSYIVLARKWRPAQFADIVGQSHVVRTLANAIRSERLHHAYLFTGSRGIGKTSIARIFAKAIRCENAKTAKTDRPGSEWIVSCDQCPSCREIAAGNGVDVIEIDGASNNGVEAVREIRENAKYMPSTGSRKIYIIDEVHMLTTAAFNALLKTLEEPPAHVIFMFATTEPHKIPATILSRCQRFDLRKVTLAQIQARLIEVTKAEEGLLAEPGALALIARAAEGSMRDALSLLDQVIAFSEGKVTVSSVRESVGLIEGQSLMGILRAVFSRQPLDALALAEQAYQRGHDLRVLGRSLIEFLHAAVLAKVGAPNPVTLELAEEEWKELQEIAALRSLEEIELIFQVFHQGLEWIARSPQPKAVLDILLVKCAMSESLVYADGATPASPATNTTNSGAAEPKPSAQVSGEVLRARTGTPAAVVASAPAAVPEPAPSAAQEAGKRGWEGFIEFIRKTRPLLSSILEHGSGVEISETEQLVKIFYRNEESYYLKQLQSRAYHEQFAALSKDYFGKSLRLSVEFAQSGDSGESLAGRKDREQKDRQTKAREAAQNHPVIREAQSLFGGELGPIELTDSDKDSGAGHANGA